MPLPPVSDATLIDTNITPNTEARVLPGATLVDGRHPIQEVGPAVGLYVWQYPLRLFHWGMVLCLAVLSFTGYYIHDPFIVGQVKYPFLMAWFRFAHEVLGMILISLFILRMALFFQGNRWVGWRQYIPLHASQFREMLNVMKFYGFINPKPVSKIGHNAMAAFSYIGIYNLFVVEIVTGLVLYNRLRHSGVLGALIGWVPGVISAQNVRLIHFFLMFVFIAFRVFHVHLCMLISRVEKRGLMDSIFTGYKVVPENELEEEEKKAIAERS